MYYRIIVSKKRVCDKEIYICIERKKDIVRLRLPSVG